MITLGQSTGGGIALDLLAVLACAGVTAVVLGRLRVAVIPGYLLAGVIFGPHGVGLVSDPQRIEEIAPIATVLLMFSVGMQLDTSSLRRGASTIVVTGVASTLATAVCLSGVAMAAGQPAPTALAMGMALSMSSTAVMLRLLQTRRELHEGYGRMSLGVSLVQDLMAIAFLALLPVLAAGQDTATPEDGSRVEAISTMALAVGGVASLIVVGKLTLPRLMRIVAGERQAELMLVVAAAAALGAAVLTSALGLSPEFGAFIAGFLLSSTPFRHHLSGQITPIRDLFMAVFFTLVGMRVSVGLVLPVWWVVVGAVVAMIAVKAVLIAGIAWASGASNSVSVKTGLALGPGSEFSLLILTVAASLGLVSGRPEAVVIATVVVSLTLAPLLLSWGKPAAAWASRRPVAPWFAVPSVRDRPSVLEAMGGEASPKTRAIIAGFGPVGRACAARLEAKGVPYAVVEINARTVWSEAQRGVPIMYGDVTSRGVLENAGIEHAEVIVFTMPDRDSVFRGISAARAMRPDIHIATRATLVQAAEMARHLGANEVVVEEAAVAEILAASLERRLAGEEQGP